MDASWDARAPLKGIIPANQAYDRQTGVLTKLEFQDQRFSLDIEELELLPRFHEERNTQRAPDEVDQGR